MAKHDWGTRYVCFACGCKFYDLNRPEPLCPRCGADQREATQDSRPARPSRSPGALAEEVPEPDLLEEPLDLDFDEEPLLEDEEEELEEELEEDEEEEY